MEKLKLFVVAGEFSGDMHGAAVVEELSQNYEIELYGTGGPKLAALGQTQFATVNDMSVMGFVPVLKKLPYFLGLGKKLERELLKIKPDLVLLVDYTGFNLRFAKRIRKHGFPAVELVAPQVWIWHHSRVKTMRYAFDKVLAILPFEEEYLKKYGVNAVYIGHPLVAGLTPKVKDRDDFCRVTGLDPDKPVIGLVPGSRPKEIANLMPVFMDALAVFAEKYPDYQYVLARAASVSEEVLHDYIKDNPVKIVTGLTPDVMRYAQMLWICSGTATLEAAIIGTPMILLYKVPVLDEFIVKRLTTLRMIGMPNIISGKQIVPELQMKACNPVTLVEHAEEMRENLSIYKERLRPISAMFEGKEPIKNAAAEIIETLKSLKVMKDQDH